MKYTSIKYLVPWTDSNFEQVLNFSKSWTDTLRAREWSKKDKCWKFTLDCRFRYDAVCTNIKRKSESLQNVQGQREFKEEKLERNFLYYAFGFPKTLPPLIFRNAVDNKEKW